MMLVAACGLLVTIAALIASQWSFIQLQPNTMFAAVTHAWHTAVLLWFGVTFVLAGFTGVSVDAWFEPAIVVLIGLEAAKQVIASKRVVRLGH